MVKKKIMLDAGHGGKDPGTIGATGTKEKDISLIMVKVLQRLLNIGYDVRLTRSEDRYLSLRERTDMANEQEVNVFISIHCNGFYDPSAHGFEVYTYYRQTRSDLLATEVYKSVSKQIEGVKLRTDYTDGDPDKEDSFWVLRGTKMPAILIELGFITNPEEERNLKSKKYINLLAQSIVNAVDNYFNEY